MKIITRKELMNMPGDTLFSYYVPCVFTELCVKTGEVNQYLSDFLVDNLIGALECNGSDDFIEKCEEMENGKSVELDFEFTGREGLFEDKQLFAIYEKKDVEKLIERLQKTLL